MTDLCDIVPPQARDNFLGAPGFEAQLAQLLNAGALANGWLITGGEGAGKATLAFRLARALLWRQRPPDSVTLDVPKSAQEFALVASGGHPDLFVAARRFDHKKERYETEITVETVRSLNQFLNHTASMGGWRVAIIDTAEDLNRNSANALLKVLEEPPPRAALFVLSSAPGRLLATIRSRCRRIELRPLPKGTIAAFLEREGVAASADAQKIADVAGGRPGFALALALGAGATAIDAVSDFWSAAAMGGDISNLASRLAAKEEEGAFAHFRTLLNARLAVEAKSLAVAGDPKASAFVDLHERFNALFTRAEAVNLDRYQILLAAGRAFGAALR
jgi:DNA polymerase-3 subunit delta'